MAVQIGIAQSGRPRNEQVIYQRALDQIYIYWLFFLSFISFFFHHCVHLEALHRIRARFSVEHLACA